MDAYTASFAVTRRKNKARLSAEERYGKRLLLYTLFYTLAFAAGCLLFHLLHAGASVQLNARILAYFDFGFSDCKTLTDGCALLLRASSQELYHLFLVFAAGFTLFAAPAILVLLAFRGFALGFSVSYLTFAVRYSLIALARPRLSVIVYTVLCALTAVVFIHFGVRSSAFSEAFKSLCGDPKRILTSKSLYLHLFRFFVGTGAILLLNLLRCVL